MKTVKLPLLGGCQCGALRYSVNAAPMVVYACHCTNCQRQTGSSFVLSMAVLEPSLSFSRGEPRNFKYSSDAGNQRYGLFCGCCGGRIANGQDPSIGILSLRAGTLDDAKWVAPSGHIWTKSAQDWIEFSDDDILCDGQPTDYTPYAERFRAMVQFED